MKLIKATKDQYSIVDDDTYDYLNTFSWHSQQGKSGKFYPVTDIRYSKKDHPLHGKQVAMHKMIMWLKGIELKENEIIDHIDRNPMNNQLFNLRKCSKRQNSFNKSKKLSISTSKYNSVFLDKRPKKNKNLRSWYVQIKLNYRARHVATVHDEILAATIHDQVAKYYFGKFANLNFPEKDLEPLSIEGVKNKYSEKYKTKCNES